MSKTQREWLTYETAPDYLGCSKRQLQRWVQQKRIGHTRLGNSTLFSHEQLDEFIARSTVEAAS